MKLIQAINKCSPDQLLYRKKWKDDGVIILLSVSSLVFHEVTLTPESLQADDWEIVDAKGK